ncbi:DUF934 domain-containing protein [Commensalibacter melissae]|uniref:Oxidoreductase n=1 Tax=Commensalibacter melissae TaxID=2070537 RepID=A0A318MWN0_9PROT|nr:DUF934 domain-containing protein [Commensalibacter melissae]PXZ00315.1 hypothetical protein DK869_06715 [Commensalibacter melissae]QGT67815.1 DUF934 domain-containing protein [Commensalibacter melissae]
MLLLKDGEIIDNPWIVIENNLPTSLPDYPILSQTLLSTLDNIDKIHQPLGVLLPCDQDIEHLRPYLEKLSLIVLEFPSFKDGRAFSQARQIREHLKFTGELRAIGHILPDQYQFLTRVGFTTILIPDNANIASWKDNRQHFTIGFQSSVLKEPKQGLVRKL